MKFRIRFAQQVVGVFVLLGFAGIMLLFIFMGINQRWFARNYTFTTMFQSGDGLSEGMSIKLRGFEIGKVADITLNQNNQVMVDFYIYDTYYEKIKPNSVIELSSNPLGLGGGLQLYPGRNNLTPLEEFTFIPSNDTQQGRDLVSQGLVDRPQGQDQINDLITRVQGLLEGLQTTLVRTNSIMAQVDGALAGTGNGPVAGVLLDLNRITSNATSLTNELRDPTGLVPRLMESNGSVGTLFDDDNELFNNINGILVDVQGTVGQLDETMTQVNSILRELEAVSRFANRSTPQISGLLEDGREAVQQGRDVLEGIRNNPLIRGGITPLREQDSTMGTFRDEVY